MHHRIVARLLAGVLIWPCAVGAQELMAERFGYCQLVDQNPDRIWVTPVFDVEIPVGRMYERQQQDSKSFVATVRAQSPVTEGLDAYCQYSPDRRELEKRYNNLRNGFRLVMGPTPFRPVAWSPSPLPVQAPPNEIPVADAMDAGVLQSLESDAFFRVPAGKATTVEWSAQRVHRMEAGDQIIRTPVSSRFKVKRGQGNQCSVETHAVAGEPGTQVTTDDNATSWAGLVSLTSGTRMNSDFAQSRTRLRTHAIRHEGELFPLREGASTTLRTQAEISDDTGTRPLVQQLKCTTGATVSAATKVANATGDATELRCELSFPDMDGNFRIPVVYQWFSDVGCFVQDPSQPSG